ncbi:MAG: hypothetical protein MMC23_010017 [Stictis urceolatum]|nr:hypothetical protein [Stictis urceolata]
MSSIKLPTFTSEARSDFVEYLRQNPNKRRISKAEMENIIDWLTDPERQPISQQEYSRRNYVRRVFSYDENKRSIYAVDKNKEARKRLVITEDKIAEAVDLAHQNNAHGGWDATWRDISSSCYGILRSDVIFLLKRCQTCAQIPYKRPKNFLATSNAISEVEQEQEQEEHTTSLEIVQSMANRA